MKICHVITRMIIGGAQENTLFTLKGHIENSHDSTLITGLTTGPEGNLLAKFSPPKLRIIRNDHLRREISVFHDFMAYRTLRKTFLKEKFDIVHTHSSKAGVVARYAAASAGIPVIVHTVHGPSFHPYQGALRNRVYILAEKFASLYSQRVYTVADAMTKLYLGQHVGTPDQYKTVYSGMELTPYLLSRRDHHLGQELGIRNNAKVVGKVARLFELKGYDYLLEAAPTIVGRFPNVQFLIVGDGLLSESIKKQVRDLGLSENFVFTGLVDPSEVHRYVALMDILVHLSLREGLPRSVVQGLAAGKPVVGFALDGTPEAIIDGNTGILCPPKDSQSVATAVMRLLNEPDMAKEMGANGRQHARKHWDWRQMVEILEEDYKRLLAKA